MKNMTENKAENMNCIIGDVSIEITKNYLVISPTQKQKRRILLFLIIGPIVYLILSIWLFNLLANKISITIGVFSIVIALIGSYSFFYSLFKSYKNYRPICIEKKASYFYLNRKKICKDSDIDNVIIQPKAQLDQIVSIRNTIGIQIGRASIPITYDHNSKNASEIANKIANIFQCAVKKNKIIYIPIFTKW